VNLSSAVVRGGAQRQKTLFFQGAQQMACSTKRSAAISSRNKTLGCGTEIELMHQFNLALSGKRGSIAIDRLRPLCECPTGESTGLFRLTLLRLATLDCKYSGPIGFIPVGLLYFYGRLDGKTRSNCRFRGLESSEYN
jgi:hypothetical protein